MKIEKLLSVRKGLRKFIENVLEKIERSKENSTLVEFHAILDSIPITLQKLTSFNDKILEQIENDVEEEIVTSLEYNLKVEVQIRELRAYSENQIQDSKKDHERECERVNGNCERSSDNFYRNPHNDPRREDSSFLNSQQPNIPNSQFQRSYWCRTDEEAATDSLVPTSGPLTNAKKPRNAIPVGVFDPMSSEATVAFFTAFKQMLHSYGIIAEKISKFSDGKAPVIVICNMASRLETDIDRTLSSVGKADYSRVVLITLHVKPKHALPEVRTKEQLYEEKYRGLREVVDIAFTKADGFYNCQMNDDAVSELRRLFADTT